MNLLALTFQSGYGMQQAMCALVGRAIGKGSVSEAKSNYKGILTVSTFMCLCQAAIVYGFRAVIMPAFTSSESLIKLMDKMFLVFTIVMF